MRVPTEYFRQDAISLAQGLLGKDMVICRNHDVVRCTITETEAYCGEEDKACHASKGRTARTSVMYQSGGVLYVYLIYGMYQMLNVVAGQEGRPEAVLIRGIEGFDGPGRLTRHLSIDQSMNGLDIGVSDWFWFEDKGRSPMYQCLPRVGINYAGEPWVSMPWRFRVIM